MLFCQPKQYLLLVLPPSTSESTSELVAGRTILVQPGGRSHSERGHGLLPTAFLLDFRCFFGFFSSIFNFRIFGLFSVFSVMHQNTGTLPTHFHPSWWMFFSLAWTDHLPFSRKTWFLNSERPTSTILFFFLFLVFLVLFLSFPRLLFITSKTFRSL